MSEKVHHKNETARKEGVTKKTTTRHKVLSVIGMILCILLIPILVINVSLIIRSYVDPDSVPSLGGVFPLIVLSDSMYPEIQGGDLIICHTEDAENIQVGDIISFFDPAGNGTSVVTHRVVEITEADGEVQWITRGDANNANDAAPVTADDLVGVYRSRIPNLGNVVMWMQSTTGLIVCVFCPILLLAIWDFVRRRKYEQNKQDNEEALMKELEELRAQKGALESSASANNDGDST